MSNGCDCHGTQRRLALRYPGPTEDMLELWAAAERFGWCHILGRHSMQIALGPSARFQTVAALADFIRALAPDAFPRIRAQWVGADSSAIADWTGAPRLQDMTALPSPPILWILENRAIETWFQPIVRADNQSPWGYECLMRARDSTGQPLPPEQVIAWARQEHLLFTLDRLCRELHVQHAATSGAAEVAHFFINFLPTVIYDPEVCLRSTVRAAARAGLAPERIVFEVVETEKIPDRDRLRQILDYYRSRGFRVALDDLGAGNADLMLLGDLSPDVIKIERELIAKSPGSSIHRSICRSITNIGREQGKLVLAEGVETAEEWAFIETLGVDLVQGFFFGPPQPAPLTHPS